MSSRKPKHEEHENHERWLVSYADFITLLFAFFVVMYATSNSDLEKQKSFEESVQQSMGLAAQSAGPRSVPVLGQASSPAAGTAPIDIQLPSGQDRYGNEIEEAIDTFMATPVAQSLSLSSDVEVVSEKNQVTLKIDRKKIFKGQTIQLDQQGALRLVALGQLVKKLDSTVSIAAPLSYGAEESLSQAAFSQLKIINHMLVDRLGIDPSLVTLVFDQKSKSQVDSEMIRLIIRR